ncbi:acyl-CoA thioesterase [Rubrobacter indicoceani]|uniref:acyl-CoA thioesterase n=1 Tax=Rubrobacter indicoceani TaxID=2051957 RepID=UPI000E5B71C7|nr:thioesterase family protein [Rubrobacter indicoceani]
MNRGDHRTSETRLRVRYSETDAQRIVNNGVYLAYFEVGRVEWLRNAGFSYAELERDGYGFVVVKAEIEYGKPARFDDELTVRTTLLELRRASLSFAYKVLRGEELLVAGKTRHGCIDIASGRPVRIPAGLGGDRIFGAKDFHETKTR